VSRDGNATDRALYGDLPATTEMFPAHVALRDTVRQRDADVADGLGLDTAARQARNREFVALAATGLDPSVIAPLYHAVTDAELAAKRGRAADPAAVHAQEEAGRALRAAYRTRYGAEGLEALERDTDRFIAQHPQLQRVLATGDVGQRADIRERLLEHVRQQRLRTPRP
jgi:hypothetical protein